MILPCLVSIVGILPFASALCKRPPEEHGLLFGAFNTRYQFTAEYFKEGITLYVRSGCDPGYYLIENSTDSVCQADGSWDPPPARCVKVRCQYHLHYYEVVSGYCTGNTFIVSCVENATITRNCFSKRNRVKGPAVFTGVALNTWYPTPSESRCERDYSAFCALPSLTPHLRIVRELSACLNGTCAVNTELLLTCDPDYHFVGYGRIICRGADRWFPSEYKCEATCPDPKHGRVSYSNKSSLSNGRYSIGSEASFQCDNGYRLINNYENSTCQSDGTWNPPPVCTQVLCWKIELLNGQIHSNKPPVNGSYPSGTSLTFSCDSGYELDTEYRGGSRESTYCLSDGFWSYYPPKCKPVLCWKIQELSNGKIHSNQSPINGSYPFGTTLTFSCDSGYVLDTSNGGRESSYCLSSGFWSHYPPTCRLVLCWKINQLSNGQIHSNRPPVNGLYSYGTTLTFSCDPGYVLDTSMGGRESTYCLSDGFWSFYPPKCVAAK